MDSLTITILFIVLSTVIGAFIKGRMRDKCLLDFSGDHVNVELKSGKIIWGLMRLEATGLELNYREAYLDKKDNHIERSFVLYKGEYPNIQCVARYIDDLDGKDRKRRERFLRSVSRRHGGGILRRIRNFFATVRDSMIEVANILVGKAKQLAPVQSILSGQDKYVSQMQSGIASTLNTSFEPLLERHIGKKVILQLSRNEGIVEYPGILKGYTAEFLEVMEVPYKSPAAEAARGADIIVPRTLGVIRHLSE
jgi:hypothetical protein